MHEPSWHARQSTCFLSRIAKVPNVRAVIVHEQPRNNTAGREFEPVCLFDPIFEDSQQFCRQRQVTTLTVFSLFSPGSRRNQPLSKSK
jgi:hypothetical protein